MPYLVLPTKVRKDPFGPQALNALGENLDYARTLIHLEHIAVTGEHNAWEVPRIQRQIVFSGGAYTHTPAGTDIVSIATPAVGTVVFTLAAGRFGADIRVQCNALASEAKPVVFGYEAISATELRIYLKTLASALGAGNLWTPVNASFDVAIHSAPLAPGAWGVRNQWALRGKTLDTHSVTAGATHPEWNLLVNALAETHMAARAAHGAVTVGQHSVEEVARVYCRAEYDNVTPKWIVLESSGGFSFTFISTGICDVTHPALNSPRCGFVLPHYARGSTGGGSSGDLFAMGSTSTASTTTRIYMYKFDSTVRTWARGNGDFFLAIHGA